MNGHVFTLSSPLVLSAFISGCISASNPIDFRMAPADRPHAILRLDNRMDAESFFKSALYVNIWIDGSQPSTRHWLPYGVTELRLEPGLHEIIHRGVTPAGLGADPSVAWGPFANAYHATDPLVMDTTLEAGKTYTIRFHYVAVSWLKAGYRAEYEGWPTPEVSGWSRTHPIRSHLRGPDPFWLGSFGLRLAARSAAGPADYVAVIASEPAYTVFHAFPASKRAEVEATYATAKDVRIYDWGAFERDAPRLVKARVLRDEYPNAQVSDGILALLRQYPGNPFGVTWNGGVAITANDYDHAEWGYETYRQSPAEYDRLRPLDPREDPIDPRGHFRPLLAW